MNKRLKIGEAKKINLPKIDRPMLITSENFFDKNCEKEWLVKDLKMSCKYYNLGVSGKKNELCERLRKYFNSFNDELENWTLIDNIECFGSDFYVRECGGGGDCQFYSITDALRHAGFGKFTMKDLRKITADQITDENFSQTIEYYRLLHSADLFEHGFDPWNITKQELKEEIMKTGSTFQGDEITIRLLSEAFNVSIVVYNQINGNFVIHGDLFPPIIFLYYSGEGHAGHYRLIGQRISENKIITIFDNIPTILEDCQVSQI